MQVYVDDTVLYVHAKTKQEVVCMFCSQQPAEGQQPSVLVNGERLDVVEQFINLTFKGT